MEAKPSKTARKRDAGAPPALGERLIGLTEAGPDAPARGMAAARARHHRRQIRRRVPGALRGRGGEPRNR